MHWTSTRVRYGETDHMGVVYHANYFIYFELGRTEFVRSRGEPYSVWERDGLRLPVVDVAVRYRSPARYDEEIRVGTALIRLTPARLRFHQEVRRGEDDRLLATARIELASVDPSGRPQKLPDRLRDCLEPLVESLD